MIELELVQIGFISSIIWLLCNALDFFGSKALPEACA